MEENDPDELPVAWMVALPVRLATGVEVVPGRKPEVEVEVE